MHSPYGIADSDIEALFGRGVEEVLLIANVTRSGMYKAFGGEVSYTHRDSSVAFHSRGNEFFYEHPAFEWSGSKITGRTQGQCYS